MATAAEGNGDNNWWVAKLRTYDLEGGERVLLAPSYQMNFPRVSPDGRTVAFIGGVMSDFGSVGGDVYTVPIDGGTPVNVTPGYVGSVTSIAWRGDRLIAGIIVAGDTGTATIDPTPRRVSNVRVAPQPINAGDGAVALDARGRTAAYVSQTFERAPRIEFGPLGAGRAVTHDNDALIPVTTARDVRWTNEGYAVQGWLLAPRDAAVGARRPMIVSIHGSPAAAVTPRFVWSGTIRDLLEAGYYVFQPNPRGSYGQGAAFAQANHKDFGGGDLRDILAGVDAVEQVAPIDDERLGVYGHSYGEFMTMWTVTHSQRFKAAVAGAGIANWSSYYGQNGIDKWMVPFFGATCYDDPEVYDRQSPIRSIKAARTPTFIYVGQRDLETPAPQSIEFWHGLVAQGVPTSLVIYQDEGHSIRQPEHASDLTRRIVDWFGRYLKAPTGDGV
ncbi:prolyl oligopeptidase family serine peptidase [Brevundimonas sp.]|uniref:S9 family peptidase n=1 Tax=Brevundimonas sp. TaxID=1871086 RepID=UPI002899BFA9|nr:prolyl oligopeptidase family serine peptidase [Brevundimonas sp.]